MSKSQNKSEFYNLSATSLQGKEVNMEDFKGKVVLVVNTASHCGFTPQYEGLENLYKKYKDEGLVVLGFPCNQFGNQEPGGKEEIEQGCLINYGVSFPMMEKVDVNGNNAHPVFQYLKSELGGLLGSRVKWNFTKFLIDADGKPVKRYAPITKPEKITPDIERLLQKTAVSPDTLEQANK
ncbi:glutathione peroxidase [Pontibacter ramchanderi]|uniref:Glutathione peroxidase n=1 Tax=Pontibacter ramchanderi TaxID=1179743 RepID=A0A2N3UCA2_9BACT|nr:glutathione peroxidase [Pontibacter ramchanderi]PKV66993.1 glutathione peroxidase [Pontibacter ramchanderi]